MTSSFAGFAGVQAVLFDLDGTLIDSAPDLGAAADLMRTSRGLTSIDPSVYRPMAGAGARGMLSVAFGMTPDHPDFNTLREEFFVNYGRSLTQNTLIFPGVAALVDTLVQSGTPWGVVTNKAERFTTPLTKSMSLFASAGAIISGDTTAHSKPHPLPLLEAARRLNVAPERCVYVGDDERDIVAGLAAGMGTVAATYGYLGQKSDISQWGAHATINSAHELLQLISPA